MLEEFKLIASIAPDMLDVVQERFDILRNIYWMQPIGRKSLSDSIGMTERVLRTETDFLKRLQLIEASKSGMTLTDKGLDVYHNLELAMDQLLGMRQTEKKIAQYFGIKRCIVIAGNSDLQDKVFYRFGDILTDSLNVLLPNGNNTIAVMGGTTMSIVARHMGVLKKNDQHNLFVPARGGIGEAVTVQANSISSEMAEKTGGEHRALYVPEQLSKETYDSLLQEPSIQEVLTLIKQANCVVHSIGRALHMAARRKMSDEELVMLKQKNAVAESFGYFFDEQGEVVYKIPRIGLQLKNLQDIPYILALAGGSSKAKAIAAYMKNAPKQTWLITDEAAANAILKGATL
ncbi:sugar-binding transcriptional regulator [Melissococcus plutonius]|uniref:Central glycolytic genes regulator n=1 Tax=Melissococcus plutonius (strain ATCC 35311 / DSM 29964 / CIP 104052 / LMG 20360 / NCIMB 702443) TaxID=940190 RepID=F3YA11_MELPT|nr:sugar-binding domain-containing protein [Melissococcus plutonius]AIM24852.1 central glycolytic genes regulator [Melissococcus plutonius S1]KMT24983.1 central glycolytic genes regulator [Melissococcus plutonius]KMT26619.1 central glycolytic genes regulator [Melissococcus plutonius]KMT27869.1 central glycolytic genes regulator [Melissococcus plutonius]KMT29642.1 central glycolytic genes regulator [Melissococcus plutonius]